RSQHNMGSRISILLALLASLLFVPVATAADGGPGQLRNLSPEPLKALVADYSTTIDELEESGEVPGLSTAIVYRKKVLLEKSIGVTDISTGEPVTPTTVFRLASLSKAFTSTLAGLLVEGGRLQWNTHVADILPYFR